LSARAFPSAEPSAVAAGPAAGETPLERLRRERALLRERLSIAQAELQNDIGMLQDSSAAPAPTQQKS
jgi:hypothetical protein